MGGVSASPDILQKIDSVKQRMEKPIPGDVTSLKGKGYHVFIGVPARNNTCSMGYAESLALTMCAFLGGGVEIGYDTYNNSCMPEITRNLLLAQFYRDYKKYGYTHLLMIDNDAKWMPIEAPLKMLSYQKEFIAGLCPMKKGEDEVFACTLKPGQTIDDNTELIEMINVGGAFLLLSAEMIEKMVEAYPNLKHPLYDGFPRLFEHVYTEDQSFGEDMTFCKRWVDIGGKIWVYADIHFEHLGERLVCGNYKQFLKDNRENPKYFNKQVRLLGDEIKQVA